MKAIGSSTFLLSPSLITLEIIRLRSLCFTFVRGCPPFLTHFWYVSRKRVLCFSCIRREDFPFLLRSKPFDTINNVLDVVCFPLPQVQPQSPKTPHLLSPEDGVSAAVESYNPRGSASFIEQRQPAKECTCHCAEFSALFHRQY